MWFHADMLPGNLIVHDGRVRAVIDFSGLGVGDPACDVMIAWALFWGGAREIFRRTVEVDDRDLDTRSASRARTGRAVHPVLPGHESTRRHRRDDLIDEVLADAD